MHLKLGQAVRVDGDLGEITGIYPNGKGIYQGPQHAHIWVSAWTRHGMNVSRAVPFEDIERRVVFIEENSK